MVVIRPQAHKLTLASALWVFSFAYRMFKYWFFVIEQTAHNIGVSTSVSAPEIADPALVSVPAAGDNLVHHILNNHLTTASI